MDNDIEILIAEDDEGHFILTRKYLLEQGVKNLIRWYAGGDDILEFLFNSDGTPKDIDPSKYVLLLDIRMPGTDGLEVLKRIRSNSFFAKLAVIVLTSSADPVQIEQAEALGADSYIVKPVKYSSYIEAMQKIGLFPSAVEDGVVLRHVKHNHLEH